MTAYGRASTDKEVRSHCNKCIAELLSSKKDIEGNWNKINQQNPKLSNQEKIQLLVKLLKISEGTLYNYSRNIEDDELRKGIEKSYYTYVDNKHGITNLWLKILNNNKIVNGRAYLEKIAKETGLSPVTVATISRRSKNLEVRNIGSRLTGELSIEKYDLTRKWKMNLNDKPILEPAQIAEKLSKELNLEASTIASYALYSQDEEVKSSANFAYNVLRERKYDIINQWKILEKTPEEIVKFLAEKTGLKEITICAYARHANDKKVKKESIKLYTQLLEKSK